MVAELLAALDGSALANWLRASFWVYPFINTAHVLGIALLVGAIGPVDARLLGAWPEIPLQNLTHSVLPFAMAGCMLAILSGSLLFVVQPLDYAGKPIFWVKLGLVTAGVANALLLRRTAGWQLIDLGHNHPPAPRLRWAGGLSLGFWLGALVLGRLLAYV